MKNLGFKWPPANSSLSLLKKNNIHTFSFFSLGCVGCVRFKVKDKIKTKKNKWNSLHGILFFGKNQTVVIETIDHSFVYHISRDKGIIINTQYLGI